MTATNNARYAGEAVATWAKDLILSTSLHDASVATGIARETLARLAAGLPVRRGTILVAQQAMADLDGDSGDA